MIRLNINQELKLGVRKIMRPIVPTPTQRRGLETIYLDGLNLWVGALRSEVLPAYARAVTERKLTQDDSVELSDVLDSIGNGILFALSQYRTQFSNWFIGIATWHTDKFVGQIARLTRLNLGNQVVVRDVTPTITTFVESNMTLFRSVVEQARGRIAEVLFRNLQLQTNETAVRRQLGKALQLSLGRVKRISYDQINKFTSDLDHDRHSQLGIPGFIWEHSRKEHYRPWHKTRDGQYFAWDSTVARTDPPGQAPFCGCKARGVLGR